MCGPLLLAVLAVPALGYAMQASDEVLARARALYAGASYEEALGLLEHMSADSSTTNRVEVEAYRAWCLMALGRNDDSRRVIESLVETDPFYQPSAALASPKMRAVFDEVRQASLPTIVKRSYTDAKAALDRRDANATILFKHVLDLLNDPVMAARPDAAELRLVVSGFLDLSRAVAQPAQTPPPTVAAAAPSTPTLPSLVPDTSRREDAGFTPPVPLSRSLPAVIRHQGVPSWNMQTLLELEVDEKGSVLSVRVLTAVPPSYYHELVRAVMSWKYAPARKDGQPVRARTVVPVRVQD